MFINYVRYLHFPAAKVHKNFELTTFFSKNIRLSHRFLRFTSKKWHKIPTVIVDLSPLTTKSLLFQYPGDHSNINMQTYRYTINALSCFV